MARCISSSAPLTPSSWKQILTIPASRIQLASKPGPHRGAPDHTATSEPMKQRTFLFYSKRGRNNFLPTVWFLSVIVHCAIPSYSCSSSSSSSSSSTYHGTGPLVDPFWSHMPRCLFNCQFSSFAISVIFYILCKYILLFFFYISALLLLFLRISCFYGRIFTSV
jgi:hypothetical protein